MISPTETGYEFARPTGVCALSGKPFTVGETYVAVLIDGNPDNRLERKDFAVEAWESGAALTEIKPPRRALGFWRASMPEPTRKTHAFIDDAALLDLFEQLVDADLSSEPGRTAFRYVLALILIRKRLLRAEGGRGGPLTVRFARDGQEGRAFEIPDPNLEDAVIAEATEHLAAVMQAGSA